MGIKYRKDDDLAFLQYCTNEDISKLAGYLIKYNGYRRKFTKGNITKNKKFKELNGDPDKWKKCWKLVAGELQYIGGNLIVNSFRGKGILYKEILSDVCDKLHVKHRKKSSAYDIENHLIEKLTKISWEKMSAKEKEKAIGFMYPIIKLYGFKDDPLDYIISSIKEGEGSFRWSYWLAQSSSLAFDRVILQGLSLGAISTFVGTRGVVAFSGPLAAIGIAIHLISSPVYKVTIPSVIQIAYMRRKYLQEDRF